MTGMTKKEIIKEHNKETVLERFYRNLHTKRKYNKCKKCGAFVEVCWRNFGSFDSPDTKYYILCDCGNESLYYTYEDMISGVLEKEWNSKNKLN